MTEAEWLSCADPQALVDFVRDARALFRTRWQGWHAGRRFDVSERKFRLFACACCRRLLHLGVADEIRPVIALAEQHAEGVIDGRDLHDAADELLNKFHLSRAHIWSADQAGRRFVLFAAHFLPNTGRDHANPPWTWAARAKGIHGYVADPATLDWRANVGPATPAFLKAAERAESAYQAGLLRDIIGNPFAAATLDPDWLRWNDGCVVKMARAAYEEHRFADLPILADALEEAGCCDTAILDHCRSGTEHVRGCWLLDLILANDV